MHLPIVLNEQLYLQSRQNIALRERLWVIQQTFYDLNCLKNAILENRFLKIYHAIERITCKTHYISQV